MADARHASALIGSTIIENDDVLNCYRNWPPPTMIHVDGPYGIGGYPGDPSTYSDLSKIYFPHIAEWSKAALPSTTLWFWGTELGWATVHPLIDSGGWDYQELCVWNKGVSHIAGNVNSKTIRGVPVVTEICVRYTKRVSLSSDSGKQMSIKEWVRNEWERSGIPMYRANEACGVKNAATRKYLTKDSLWYFPPPEMLVAMAAYANQHGCPTAIPYYSLNGVKSVSVEEWRLMRAKWNHVHGVTNVWDVQALHGKERLRTCLSNKSLHYNQKPLSIVDYLIRTTTDESDVIWDPFAGLATIGASSNRLHRKCYCAEILPATYQNAVQRLTSDLEALTCQAS